jgi:hypothetical protein
MKLEYLSYKFFIIRITIRIFHMIQYPLNFYLLHLFSKIHSLSNLKNQK